MRVYDKKHVIFYLSRISFNNNANVKSTDPADLSLRSRASKSVLSSHVGGSLSLGGKGHSSLSTAAHNPHHSLNPSG